MSLFGLDHATVAQLAVGMRLKIAQVWVRIPPVVFPPPSTESCIKVELKKLGNIHSVCEQRELRPAYRERGVMVTHLLWEQE